MRTKPIIALICALLLLPLSAGGVMRAQTNGSEPSLWIEVRDEQGMPLRDACVTLVPREGEIVFRRADGQGRVRIKRLVRGHYRVTAKVDGYTAQKKEVEMGAQTETISFSLQPRNR
ncbi:MAG TPA: carboxypeptidase-like regulatory domain-containing protein [Pyrinomonadaceae bacterium]|jgi:hypothetical protein